MEMKAGAYYIGDPCYVVKSNEWGKLLDRTDHFADKSYVYRGHDCFVARTAYGDGRFEDALGRLYLVDAGLIGIMPVDALTKNPEGKGGQIIEFAEDFTAEANDGLFRFGHIEIDTR